jgi:microcystin degradation protein MlrC
MHRRHFLKAASAATLSASLPASAFAASSPRLAFGGIGTECSTYSRIRTRLEDFTIDTGDALIHSPRFAFLQQYTVRFQPTLVADAVDGGPVDASAYRTLKARYLETLRAALPLDGLFLAMHGAMFVDGMTDAETDWMRSTREVVGPSCLIAVSYDLHGNVSQGVIDNIDIFSAFRTAPHIDKTETMQRSCNMLLHCLRDRIRPQLVWTRIPVMLPGERTSTEWEPGKRLWAQLPALNAQPGILDVSLLVGYVWADEPRSTAAAVVTGTNIPLQETIANNVALQFWNARDQFQFGTTTCSIDDCIQRAIAAPTHPAILADSGDNPTGGGTRDRAEVLQQLLHVVFAAITDQPATDACYKAGVGVTLPLSIGATLDPLGSKPVQASAKVLFLLPVTNPRLREAVVLFGENQREGITLVLSAYRRPYHDLVDFNRLGLDPQSFKIIVVKSGYLSPQLAPIANPSLMALSDGSINQDILRLTNFHRVPSYPWVHNLHYTPHAVLSARSR